MNACLAVLADNPYLTEGIARAVEQAGLNLTRIEEFGATINLLPKARQAVRSARIFIAAVTQKNLQETNFLYGIEIAKSGKVPIVVVTGDSTPLDLQGPVLGNIPKSNVFSLTPTGFVPDLTGRLRRLASTPLAADATSATGRPRYWYVSYTGKDQTYADELTEFLYRSRTPYLDYDHRRHEFNTEYLENIGKTIDDSAGTIVIATPNWQASERAQTEFQLARRQKKPLFLLRLEPIRPFESFSTPTIIDCTVNHEEGYHELLGHLDKLSGDANGAAIQAGSGTTDDVTGTGPSKSVASQESVSVDPQTHVVVLVHGIRDFALWQDQIRDTLEEAGFKAELTNFGRFDLFKFLVPVSIFRNQAIKEVTEQIRVVFRDNRDARISVIAHSFGTFVVSRLMKEGFDREFHRVIFCGSVVRRNFEFEHMKGRFTPPILNEVGTRDVWPAMAESVTWGYGSVGTYGFRRPQVRDRWHNGAKHNYFLNKTFCETYWIPFLTSEKLVRASTRAEEPRLWIRVLSVVHLKYFLIGMAVGAVAFKLL
jgi:hypothetical protein